jgi:hypothetical protein
VTLRLVQLGKHAKNIFSKITFTSFLLPSGDAGCPMSIIQELVRSANIEHKKPLSNLDGRNDPPCYRLDCIVPLEFSVHWPASKISFKRKLS